MADSTSSFGRFFRLWSDYLGLYKWWIVAAFIFMIIEGSTVGLLSYILQPMFDLVFVEGRENAVWLIAFGIFGLFATRALVGVAQRVIMARVAARASTKMQVDLLSHVLSLDSAFHATTSPGMLIERVQGDVMAIQRHWNGIITGAGRDFIALASLMTVAILIDWKWTAVAMIGTPLVLIPSLILQRYVRRKSVSLRNIAGKRTTRLDEIFHGITPIKLNQMEAYQSEKFALLSNSWVRATVRTTAGSASVPGLVDIAVGLGFFCVLIYGSPQVVSGEKTIGQFMSFFTALALTFQPMRRLANVAGTWQMMQASLERVFNLFDTAPAVRNTTLLSKPMHDSAQISFNDVSLSYGQSNVIEKLSFDVPAGSSVALVGQSGAGKSTVFNLLTRLVDPSQGSIEINGTKLTDMPLSDLRVLFSVVSQDALLFDETLRENILLGRTDVSDEQLTRVLRDANVLDFLPNLPNGLETKVGARGSNLSGGQRQRVAIARALLRDTPILLLDEATSALDAKAEKVVQTALDRLSEGRTTLIIAHRLSTIRNVDKIIVLDAGKLSEAGTHDDLIEKGGVYANLHALQFGE